MVRKRQPLYCSFCGKADHEVGYLVSGPCVFICNECVEMCREIGTTMLVEKGILASTAAALSPPGGKEG